jgi:hypothetical protein
MAGLGRRAALLSGPGATPVVLAATGHPWLAVLALALVVCLLGLTLVQDLRSQERREQAALLLAPVASEARADPAAVLRAVQPQAGPAGEAEACDDAAGQGEVIRDCPPRRRWVVRLRR